MERWIRFATHFAVPVVFVFSFPWFFPYENVVHLAQTFAITFIVIAGLNLLVGLANQFSVGHVGFFAIGAYGAAFFRETIGLPLLIAIAFAAVFAGGMGFLLSLMSNRLKGLYLTLITFAFGELMAFAGASVSITTSEPALFGFQLNTSQYFWLIGVVAVAISYMLGNLFKGRYGRTFIAVGNNEKAAEAIGIRSRAWRVWAFAISAFLAGVGGGFFAFRHGMIGSPSFQFEQSLLLLLGVLLGGAGSKWGPVLGTVAVVSLQQFGPSIPVALWFIYGGAILLCMGILPNGMVGILSGLPIAKRLRANKGEILFYPSEPHVSLQNTQQNERLPREDLTVHLKDLAVFKDLSVLENVMIGFHRYFRTGLCGNLLDLQRVDKEEHGYFVRAYEILRLVGLEKKAFCKASTLTSWERRILGLARGIALNPSVLLVATPEADEIISFLQEKGLSLSICLETGDPIIQKKVEGYAN